MNRSFLFQNRSFLYSYLFADVSKEGLFRVSGSKKRQEELKDLLDKEENIDFDNGRFTPHDVASVLKIFLGDLPEPLLTHAPQNAYLQITGKSFMITLYKHIVRNDFFKLFNT